MPKKTYEGKRDFTKTPEPSGVEGDLGAGPLRYCIQKHAARRLHYDVRLEIDGVLVSWAVPKGPSYNPADKHLAVHVEDHPLSYAEFEGQIPKGEYGGGEIIVWDQGVYSPDEDGKLHFEDRAESLKQMREGMVKGKLGITFRGAKLRGSWTLVKTHGRDREGDEWLMIKHTDEYSSETKNALEDERSVLTGRTVEDVAAGREGVFSRPDLSALEGAEQTTMPRKLEPMAAGEVEKPFTKPDWQFEVKLDGVRVLALVQDKRVKLLSRNARDITEKFPALVREIGTFPHESFILDGEVVRYDDKGLPTFQGLMERFQRTNPRDIERCDQTMPIEFCVFDLLYLDGWDLRGSALSHRRELLEGGGFSGAFTRVLDAYPQEGELVFERAKEMGFEGVVAKKLESKYKDGTRTQNWLKIKGYHSDNFVVFGMTEGDGMRRSTFGALVLGEREGEGLKYAGNVGGGFSDQQLDDIRAKLDEAGENPFGPEVVVPGKVTWVKPKICVEVRYMARTREGYLRHPVFQRLRPDVVTTSESANEEAKSGGDLDSILEQLSAAKKTEDVIVIAGEKVKFTNLDRVFWPAHDAHAAVTKRDLAMYYAKIAPYILPHLKDRPLAFVRCPDGIGGEHFFQKHWEKGLPDFVEQVPIWSSHNSRATKYIMVNNLPTLVWLAQIAILEIHPWYSRATAEGDAKGLPADTGSNEDALDASVLSYPDFMVVDLDPNIRSGKEKEGAEPEFNEKAFSMTVDVAKRFKEMLDDLGLVGYLKMSGKTGLHIYIPIERNLPYQTVRMLCQTLGQHLEQEMPDKVTMEWVVSKRPEKIFFDHNQNVRGKTLVSIYSPRPSPGAPISFPIDWSQLGKVSPMQFTVHSTPGALAKLGDRWKDIFDRKQDLHSMLG